MKLNLDVARELLEPRFPLLAAPEDGRRLFDNVKCYLGQQILEDFTLYLVPQHRQEGFLEAYRHAPQVCAAFFPTREGGDLSSLPDDALVFRVERTEQVLEALTAVQGTLDELRRWETRLADMRGRGYPMREFLKVGFEVIGNPMILYNDEYLIVASTQPYHVQVEEDMWKSLLDAGYWTPEARSNVRIEAFNPPNNQASYFETNLFEHNYAVTRFVSNAAHLGTLTVLEYFRPITPGRLHLIQMFSDILYLELCEAAQRCDGCRTGSDNFIRTALTSPPHSLTGTYLDRGLMRLGWKSGDDYHVLVFKDMFPNRRKEYVPEYIRNRFQGSYCLEINKQLVTVLWANGMGLDTITSQLADLLRESVMKCGVSASFHFPGIQYAYQQAQAALQIGEMLDPTFWYYRFSDYAVDYIASFALQSASLETICEPAILALDREDQASGSAYIQTLEAYLAAGSNLKKLADSLHMHRNTLQYRLSRIAQMTGIDYRDEGEMKKLYLSIRLLRLSRSLPRQEEARTEENRQGRREKGEHHV